jgi:hypothetical protein
MTNYTHCMTSGKVVYNLKLWHNLLYTRYSIKLSAGSCITSCHGIAMCCCFCCSCTSFVASACDIAAPMISHYTCLYDSSSRYYYCNSMYCCFFLEVVACSCSCSSRCASNVCCSTYIFVTSVLVGGSRKI